MAVLSKYKFDIGLVLADETIIELRKLTIVNLIQNIVRYIYLINRKYYINHIKNNVYFTDFEIVKEQDDNNLGVRFYYFYLYLVEEFYWVYTHEFFVTKSYFDHYTIIMQMKVISNFASMHMNQPDYYNMNPSAWILTIRNKTKSCAESQFEYMIKNILYPHQFGYYLDELEVHIYDKLISHKQFVNLIVFNTTFTQIQRTSIVSYLYNRMITENQFYETIQNYKPINDRKQNYRSIHLLI